MKFLRVHFLLHACIIVWLTSSLAAVQPLNVSDFRALIEQVKRTMSERGREEPSVYMDSPKWLDGPECAELQNALQVGWADVLNSFQDIAPDDVSQTILIIAAQGLPADNYLQFMSRAIDLAQNQTISQREFVRWGLMPQRPPLRHYLMNSFEDPKVRELVLKAKMLFADNQRTIGYFDNLLSGKMKKEYWEFIADGPSTPKGLPRGPNSDQGADPLGRRVWPPMSNQSQTGHAGDTANSVGTPAVGALYKSDAANRRLYTWIGIAAVFLSSGVWLFLRSRKSRR